MRHKTSKRRKLVKLEHRLCVICAVTAEHSLGRLYLIDQWNGFKNTEFNKRKDFVFTWTCLKTNLTRLRSLAGWDSEDKEPSYLWLVGFLVTDEYTTFSSTNPVPCRPEGRGLSACFRLEYCSDSACSADTKQAGWTRRCRKCWKSKSVTPRRSFSHTRISFWHSDVWPSQWTHQKRISRNTKHWRQFQIRRVYVNVTGKSLNCFEFKNV